MRLGERAELERGLHSWAGFPGPAWVQYCVITYNRRESEKKYICIYMCVYIYQFSSVIQSCPTLCDPMDCSTPGLPVHHQLPELIQTQVVMPSNHLILCCPLLLLSIFPSIRVFSQRVSSSHQVAKVLEFQLQHQSFQWIFRTNFL